VDRVKEVLKIPADAAPGERLGPWIQKRGLSMAEVRRALAAAECPEAPRKP
jgi:hypothetical protein